MPCQQSSRSCLKHVVSWQTPRCAHTAVALEAFLLDFHLLHLFGGAKKGLPLMQEFTETRSNDETDG